MFPPWYSCNKLSDIGRRVHLDLININVKCTVDIFKYLCNYLHSAISNGDGPCLDTRDLSDQHSVDLCSHDGHLIQVIDMPELPGEYPPIKVVIETKYSRG